MQADATYKKNSDQYEELKEDKQKRENRWWSEEKNKSL